jgi:hypothetical protein
MTETEAATPPRANLMLEDLRSRIAAMIRQDLAEEAAAGFPLLQRFPNSETAGVPGYFSRMRQPDREILLDALAHYSTIKWSHDIVREKKAHPHLGLSSPGSRHTRLVTGTASAQRSRCSRGPWSKN